MSPNPALGTLALNSGHSARGRGPHSWASVLPPHADKEAAVTRVISTDLTRGLSISREPDSVSGDGCVLVWQVHSPQSVCRALLFLGVIGQ